MLSGHFTPAHWNCVVRAFPPTQSDLQSRLLRVFGKQDQVAPRARHLQRRALLRLPGEGLLGLWARGAGRKRSSSVKPRERAGKDTGLSNKSSTSSANLPGPPVWPLHPHP